MTINWRKTEYGAYVFGTDASKPHKKGQSIGGIVYNKKRIKKAVKEYLGHDEFTLVHCP